MNHNQKKAKKDPLANKTLRRLGEVISDGLITLVKWNLLFLLTALPIVTIGPAMAALSFCTNALAKDDRAQNNAGRLYLSAFRAVFLRALPLGFLILFLWLFLGGTFLLYLSRIPVSSLYIPLTSASVLLFVLVSGSLLHLLPLLFDGDNTDWNQSKISISKKSFPELIREAVRQSLLHGKGTLIAVVFSFLFLGGQLMMFPALLPLTVAIGFSFPAMACALAHTEPDI